MSGRKNALSERLKSLDTLWLVIPGLSVAVLGGLSWYLFSRKTLCEEEIQYQKNYDQLIEAMEKSPRIGFYLNEDPKDWDVFFARLQKIFEEDNGPKGDLKKELSKKTHSSLSSIEQDLIAIGCSLDDDVDKLYNIWQRSPRSSGNGELYHRYLSLKSQFHSREAFLKKLQDHKSTEYKNVLNGLVVKHDAVVARKKMGQIISEHCLGMERNHHDYTDLKEQLERDDVFQRWNRMEKVLNPFFKPWVDLISSEGKQRAKEGKEFEKSSLKAMDEVKRRIGVFGNEDIEVVSNVYWNGCPGEVDHVIVNRKYKTVLALIECKLQPFDVAAGFRQSGPNRNPEKLSLNIRLKGCTTEVYSVSRSCPCFVITKKSAFNGSDVPAESKLKFVLDHLMRFGYPSDKLEAILRKKITLFCKDKQSPQRWLREYGQRYLIVLE